MRLFVTLVLLILAEKLPAQLLADNAFQLVNSLYDELNPVLSPDGKTLYFTMGNHPQNIGGKKDPGDIWFSRLLGNQWSAPVHAGSLLNDRSYNAVAGFSGDGTHLFLLSHYDPQGQPKTQGISVSVQSAMGWTKPENIVIPYFLNKSEKLSGAISPDKRVFIFSADSYNTRGVEDLYITINQVGSWSEPRNLGPVINTAFQELTPSLSDDGKTLYFSSNGRRGKGSFDVYSSTRLDDTWTNWSSPVNIGASVNSEGRELYYHVYAQLGFAMYTSTKKSDGYGDIRFCRPDDLIVKRDSLPVVSNVPDTTLRIDEVKHDPDKRNEKVVKVFGKVTNSKTGQPVAARVSFHGPAFNEQIVSAADGYWVNLPSIQQYVVKIEATGYVSAMERLDMNTYEMRELEMNFNLQPVAVGTRVNLKSVLFVQTKTELLPESYDELDLVVDFLKANPNVKIELSGHTDNRGVHADNVRLSQLRVNTVKQYLVDKGIDGKRITGKGYGGLKPITSNDTEESRKMNRRVEFTIKKF